MKLNGKTAVVTGAASGIGRATAEKLAEAGAHVILGDLNAEAGEAAAAAIRARGEGADFLKLDVTDPASIEAFGAAGSNRIRSSNPEFMLIASLSASSRN